MQQATKKKLLIGLAAAGGMLLLAAGLWYFLFISQFQNYYDKTYGFDIQYPGSWKVVRAPQPGAAVAFISPKENAMDVFSENVNITVEPVPVELVRLQNFSDKILLQMTKVFQNIKVMETKPLIFGDRQGHRVVFRADKPDAITIMNVWTIKDADKAYILTYMAMTKNYQKYLPLVEVMVQSFRLN
ncbi:MAG: hypothetical protein HY591_04365 [Candidatus Omnitrophica bacterium]|nr:hypothetical protein [Candidatus Omnitrophota bacterium]